MRKFVYTAALLAASLIGPSCNPFDNTQENMEACREKLVRSKIVAKSYGVAGLEDKLNSKEWCAGQSIDSANIGLMTLEYVNNQCRNDFYQVRELIAEKGDAVDLFLFEQHAYCQSNFTINRSLHDITNFQLFIKTYKEDN